MEKYTYFDSIFYAKTNILSESCSLQKVQKPKIVVCQATTKTYARQFEEKKTILIMCFDIKPI